jgi:hypothetical protein
MKYFVFFALTIIIYTSSKLDKFLLDEINFLLCFRMT